jgi:hypothetical protein
MKTKVNLFRLLALSGALIATSYVASAVTPEHINLTVMANKKVLLESNIPQRLAKLEITNLETSEIVYSAKYPLAKAQKAVYNLSNLPEGNYSMVLRHDNLVYEKEIRLNEGNASLVKEFTYAEPVFESDHRKLSVQYANLSGNAVTVTISNGSETLLTDNIDVAKAFSRDYVLKGFERGQYDVTLVSGDRAFHYNLYIN